MEIGCLKKDVFKIWVLFTATWSSLSCWGCLILQLCLSKSTQLLYELLVRTLTVHGWYVECPWSLKLHCTSGNSVICLRLNMKFSCLDLSSDHALNGLERKNPLNEIKLLFKRKKFAFRKLIWIDDTLKMRNPSGILALNY